MSTFDNPFDHTHNLNSNGCSCGRHVSAEHERDAAKQLQCAAVDSEDKRYQHVVVMRAMFPADKVAAPSCNRALSIEPKIMLMDEPFSALDALTRGTLQDEVRRVCQETGQTVFMITHDVDEAIYLADKIVLMTNGPGAVLAEIVENPLPTERSRNEFHKHPLYYATRNHIIDFLVSRSRTFIEETRGTYDSRNVAVLRPGLPEPMIARANDPSAKSKRGQQAAAH